MESLYKAFGTLVKEARLRANLTQGELASRLHLSRPAITGIENGNQGVSLLQLYEIASHLKVAPRDLLPPLTFESSFKAPATVQDLVSPSDQDLLLKMIGKRENASRS